jgi:hypothetical protein
MGVAYRTHGITRNACNNRHGNPEDKRPLERPRHKWEDNIKMYVQKIVWK